MHMSKEKITNFEVKIFWELNASRGCVRECVHTRNALNGWIETRQSRLSNHIMFCPMVGSPLMARPCGRRRLSCEKKSTPHPHLALAVSVLLIAHTC